jgi:hypothetical protein
MEYNKIKVYIKINEENEVIEINSKIFIKDTSNWIFIDEGEGDKYAHAQSQYFAKPLITDNGTYQYRYVNGQVRENNESIIY